MSGVIDKIKSYFSKVKHKEIIVAIALSLVLILIYFASKSPKINQNNAETGSSDYCSVMTGDVLDAVRLMTGSDECKVIINWEAGVENVIAYTTTTSGSNSTKTPEIISVNGQNSPIVLREEFPKACSVAVVCPKNTEVSTRLNIKYMISTLLGVDVNDVAIYNC